MVTDLFLTLFTKDRSLKRNIAKTISWRIVGSIDTLLLGWLISGKLIIGATIGLAEFFTKMVLYYFHERIWQTTKFGLPSTQQRAKFTQSEVKPNLFKQLGNVSRENRETLNNNQSFTLWLTGLSGAGKSTLATEIESWLHSNRKRVYILDGDNTRLGINSDLSFSAEDRTENIRRVAELGRLFNDAGIIVIASFISPFKDDRLLAKHIIGAESFVEAYVDASISVCQNRDPKGLYKLALAGKIKNFTGIDSPYEAPADPDITLDTDHFSIKECLTIVQEALAEKVK